MDKVVDVPVAVHVGMPKTVEYPQLQVIDKVWTSLSSISDKFMAIRSIWRWVGIFGGIDAFFSDSSSRS